MPRTAATAVSTRPAALARRIDAAIARASEGRSALPLDVLLLEGLSSPHVRHLMNNLCRGAGVNYLEIGTHKGSTLVAASYDNPGRFTAVDDFSEFEQLGARAAFAEVRGRFADHCRFRFHEADCWSAALRRRLPRGVNVYFYDGPHKHHDQYRAFTHFHPLFAETFIAVVDDWNSPIVRQATRRAFADLGYTTLHERELFTRRWIQDLWWNGLFLAVVRKPSGGKRKVSPGAGPKPPVPVRAAPGARRPRRAASAPARSTRPAAAGRARARRPRTAAPARRR